MNKWLKLAVVALAAVVVTQLILFRSEPEQPAEPGQAPPLALPDLSGRTVDLADLRGKVVAVNFWATWCPPCRAELPDLAEIWREHQGRCFELLGVAEESGREDVVAMARDIPYPILLDAKAEALKPWDVPAYPRTYVVDPEGRVRRIFRGALDKHQLASEIRRLLPRDCPST